MEHDNKGIKTTGVAGQDLWIGSMVRYAGQPGSNSPKNQTGMIIKVCKAFVVITPNMGEKSIKRHQTNIIKIKK